MSYHEFILLHMKYQFPDADSFSYKRDCYDIDIILHCYDIKFISIIGDHGYKIYFDQVCHTCRYSYVLF